MAKQGIKIKNKGLFLIGIIPLAIGVVLLLYEENLDMNDSIILHLSGSWAYFLLQIAVASIICRSSINFLP